MTIYRHLDQLISRVNEKHPDVAEKLRQVKSDLRDYAVLGPEFDDDLLELQTLAASTSDEELRQAVSSLAKEFQVVAAAMERQDELPISFGKLVLIISAIWVAAFLLPIFLVSIVPNLKDTLSQTGTFGDTFGSVNALFAGIALAGVAYSIFVQRIELRNQRRELRLQRRELRMQREELEQNRQELARSAAAQEMTQQITALSSQVSALGRAQQ